MNINEAYLRTIDFLRLRKRTYQLTFQNPKSNGVLKDLAKFCHANEIPRTSDLYLLGVANGRRETWLRIQNHLNLSEEDLYAIYGKPINQLRSESK